MPAFISASSQIVGASTFQQPGGKLASDQNLKESFSCPETQKKQNPSLG